MLAVRLRAGTQAKGLEPGPGQATLGDLGPLATLMGEFRFWRIAHSPRAVESSPTEPGIVSMTAADTTCSTGKLRQGQVKPPHAWAVRHPPGRGSQGRAPLAHARSPSTRSSTGALGADPAKGGARST